MASRTLPSIIYQTVMENHTPGNGTTHESGAEVTYVLVDRDITFNFVAGTTVSLDALPPRAVALDGAVRGPLQGQSDRWSFDHHDGCLRMVTLATCEQVRAAIALGGPAWFDGRTIQVNDLDGDTLMSLWLIANPHRARHAAVADLVRGVAAVDAHGPPGTSLLHGEEEARQSAFYRDLDDVLGPFHERAGLRQRLPEWPSLVDRVFERIDAQLTIPAEDLRHKPFEDSHVDVVERLTVNGQDFVLGTTEGFGFLTLYGQGVAGGILWCDAPNGTKKYTIAKRSDLVSEFPVKTIIETLNDREPGWGGGSSIGGSPRREDGGSSELSPSEVWAVASEVIRSHNG